MANVFMRNIGVFMIVILGIALWASVATVLVLNIQLPLNPTSNVADQTPTVSVVLYGGTVSTGGAKMGFGLSPNNITSPGPTLRFKVTDIVNVTFVNSGMAPHAFAVTASVGTGAPVLFNAEIGTSSNPVMPGEKGSVVFSPDNAGNSYYYECPLPGHSEMGMWGTIIITG